MKKLLYILLFVPVALFGQENYSLSFDGADDNVLVNHSASFESMEDLTISFDIKFDAYPSNYVSGGGVNIAGYRILEKWNNSNSSRSFEINIHNEGTLSSDQSSIPAQISACVNATDAGTQCP